MISSASVLTRDQTTLHGQEGIVTRDGRVIGVQVQFQAAHGEERAYADQLLANGDILLIGRGKREHGDQRDTHGNKVLVDMIEGRAPNVSFPVYEKVGANAYIYHGNFRGATSSYGELDDEHPGYKVFRFTLTRVLNSGKWVDHLVDCWRRDKMNPLRPG